MSLPGIRITVERQLAPRLPQQTGGRDPGALSLQDAAQAASVTIALNHDGAVSIVPTNCSISVKGVIPLNQFRERQIEPLSLISWITHKCCGNLTFRESTSKVDEQALILISVHDWRARMVGRSGLPNPAG